MNRFFGLLALLGSLALPCQADVIRWQFQHVTFADGGTVTGFFDYETTTHSTINWDVITSAGTAPGDPFGPGFEYTPAVSRTNSNGSDTIVSFIAPRTGLPRYLFDFTFLGSLSTPAGNVPVATFSQEVSVPAGTAFPRLVTAGTISVVPEPAAWLTLVAGLAWLGRRKLRAEG